MTRNYPLLMLLTLAVVLAGIVGSFIAFQRQGFPADIKVVDARTAVISPFLGTPLPSGLHAGDHIALSKLNLAARVALSAQNLPSGGGYQLVIDRAGKPMVVPVTTVDLSHNLSQQWFQWPVLGLYLLLSAISVLLLWRGRSYAAMGMVTWTIANVVGNTLAFIPMAGMPALWLYFFSYLLFLVARIGFYIMVEAVVGSSLSQRTRALFRWSFVLVLLASAVVAPGGMMLYVITGWAGLLMPVYGLVFGSSYFVPVAMLAVGYGTVAAAGRLRLRWMLMSSLLFLVGIYMNDTLALGVQASRITAYLLEFLGLFGFVYAVLRHRMVDVSVIIDRTLVYGGVTALVVGILAAVNSLALRATLGSGASLLLQVVVPLALGIVLHRVRTYMDMLVERVFFRSKYLAENTLMNFGRHCGHIENLQRLLDSGVDEVQRFTRSPAVAIYEAAGQGYRRLRAAGDRCYPDTLDTDDPAVVAVRAEHDPVELADYRSALGAEGCVFPINVLGRLRGVLVCANRPGEHFAPDEKRLLAQVINELGAAWRILRAKENEEVLQALADGRLEPSAARVRAQELFADLGSASLRTA